MNDIVGTELKVGDLVACTGNCMSSLNVAQIVKLAKKTVSLQYIGETHTFSKYPSACMKVPDDAATLYLLKR